jgi:hypothetical protein
MSIVYAVLAYANAGNSSFEGIQIAKYWERYVVWSITDLYTASLLLFLAYNMALKARS